MSIGKLQAALAAATNEVTLAAANINFDFTLVKCEAPKEFRPLGNALSKRRKDQAECGTAHITARRLGALFDGVLPATPCLLEAYGSRVSHIATASRRSTVPEPDNSMFSEHEGIDGTSIWAAATSSLSALHVHLLACMIARIWEATEATSIWVELVKCRRAEIESKWSADEPLSFQTLTSAAQADISKTSLAEWDASARSWLRTADRIMVKEHTQLMLFINNIEATIGQDTGVYQNVMSAWGSAVDSVAKLVSGMPQAVNDGACLLAFSSWHLYPNVLVAGLSASYHQFDDPLVLRGGVLTLGLCRPHANEPRGIFWSLSLAHLNYYGRSVVKGVQLDHSSLKVTFDEFTHAVLGAFFGTWGVKKPDTGLAARFLVSLSRAVRFRLHFFTAFDGLDLLAKAAEAHMDRRDGQADVYDKLLLEGMKRSSNFIPYNASEAFFGFGVGTLATELAEENYKRFPSHQVAGRTDTPQYATFAPPRVQRFNQRKRPYAGHNAPRSPTHVKGGPAQPPDHPGPPFDYPPWVISSGTFSLEKLVANIVYHRQLPEVLTLEALAEAGSIYRALPDATISLQSLKQPLYKAKCFKNQTRTFNRNSGPWNPIGLDLVHDDATAAPELPDTLPSTNPIDPLRFQMINNLPTPSSMDLHPNDTTSSSRPYTPDSPPIVPRYDPFPFPYDPTRVPGLGYGREKSALDQGTAFALVAYLDGGFDIDPGDLGRVFAVAFEDSIYVSMELCCDPWECPLPYKLSRVVGNIGKPGLTLLVPPENPVVKERDENSWRWATDRSFNWVSENHFSKTSMHLSFTEYYVPLVHVNIRHAQSSQVFIQESVVSVHHAGQWIGDVDVQKCLETVIRVDIKGCSGNHPCGFDFGRLSPASIETWDDLRDPPPGACVVRAHGSWLARLATTAILVQSREQDHTMGSLHLTVAPNDVCFICNVHIFEADEDIPKDLKPRNCVDAIVY